MESNRFINNKPVKSFANTILDDCLKDQSTQGYTTNVQMTTGQNLNSTNGSSDKSLQNSNTRTEDETFIDSIIPINSRSLNTEFITTATYKGEIIIDVVEQINLDDDRWPLIRDDILRFKEKYVIGPAMVLFRDFYVKYRQQFILKQLYGTNYSNLILLSEIREEDPNITNAIIFASRFYTNLKLAPKYQEI